MKRLLLGLVLLGMATWLASAQDKPASAVEKITKTRVEWSKVLSPATFTVMVDAGTERPYTSDLLKEKREGVYVSAAAPEQVLFRSADKFDSGTGWPSFTKSASPEVVILKPETHFGVTYAEVLDARTGLHLGHVFDDGPPPTGKRFCINGVALKFVPTQK